MLAVGRLMRIVDPRKLIFVGMLLTAYSFNMMAGFTPQMDAWPIVSSGIVQGLGLGLVFVPISTMAFSTLNPSGLPDATALFTLVRNIGSSIGISAFAVMLTQNTQINHSELSAFINPFNPNLWIANPSAAMGDRTALSQVDGLVNIQAQMVSYVSDFKLMMLVTLSAIPLIFLLKSPKKSAGGAAAPAVHME